MSSTSTLQLKSTLASRVAGEDISCGDFVSALTQTVEVPSYFWDCTNVTLSPGEMVPLTFVPHDSGEPFKVIAVCLPFVYVKDSFGKASSIDLRRVQLVRLDPDCAKAVRKAFRNPKSGKRRRKNRG